MTDQTVEPAAEARPEPTDIDAVASATPPATAETAPEPQPEPDAPAEAASGETPPEAVPEPEQPPKKRKTAEQALQGRVAYLTKVAADKDRELDAARSLLAAAGYDPATGAAPEGQAAPPALQPGTEAFRQAVAVEAQRMAAEQSFTADCNRVFAQGVQAHGELFKEAVANLNMMGVIGPKQGGTDPFLEAALVTDDPAAVLNHLGSDLDEAQRIASLPPIRMAAELAKLGSRLSSGPAAAKPAAPTTSSAPAPIRPIGGAAKPSGDIYDPGLSDDEYYARRAASGAPYVKAPKRA